MPDMCYIHIPEISLANKFICGMIHLLRIQSIIFGNAFCGICRQIDTKQVCDKEDIMKKSIIAVLAATMVATLALTGCGGAGDDKKSEGVMTYEEYAQAALDSEVVVETYVQDKQGWWENEGVGMATFYTQDKEGAYFLYNMPCSKEDYDKLTQGTKIKVTGYKSEWSGEVEIVDAVFEIENGNYVAAAKDVTSLLGQDSIVDEQNKYVSFKGLTIEDSGDGQAFLYNWDGSGEKGSDLYFNASKDGKTYTFTVESYLRGQDTDVYQAVEALKIGDTVDMEGFLYWYEGINPHITKITVK